MEIQAVFEDMQRIWNVHDLRVMFVISYGVLAATAMIANGLTTRKLISFVLITVASWALWVWGFAIVDDKILNTPLDTLAIAYTTMVSMTAILAYTTARILIWATYKPRQRLAGYLAKGFARLSNSAARWSTRLADQAARYEKKAADPLLVREAGLAERFNALVNTDVKVNGDPVVGVKPIENPK